MKKLLFVLCAAMLCAVCLLTACGPAIAEAAEVVPLYHIDLSRFFVAALAVVFDIILAWLVKSVAPSFKRWLDARATKDQQTVLWNLIVRFVDAAEQTFTGVGMGKQKMDFVRAALRSMGYDVDPDYIEAAVKQMNDRLMFGFANSLGIPTEAEKPEEKEAEGDADEEA